MLVLGFVSFFSITHAQSSSCVVPQQKIKAYKAKSEPKVFEDFFPNESLKVVGYSKSGEFAKILLGKDIFWAKKKELRDAGSDACHVAQCVFLKSGAQAHSRPNKKKKTQIVDQGLFKTVSKVGSWHRVKIDSGFVWLTASQFRNSKYSCDESELPSSANDFSGDPKEKQWFFGVEAGYIQNVSNEPLKNLVVPRLPAPAENLNNNLVFKTPIIPEVVDGSGWFAGVTAEFPMFWDLRNKIALGFKNRSIDIVKRPNPHTGGTVFYDDLLEETQTEDFTFIYASTAIKYSGWKMLGMVWQPGVQLGVDYSLEDFEFEFRTGTNKLALEVVESGYQTIEFIYGPRLDVQLGFFSLNMGALFTQYGMEPTFSFGLQF